MSRGLRGSLKRNVIAGLIVIAPVTATLFVLWYIFQLLDGLLGRFLYPALGDVTGRETFFVPGLGLLTLFLILVTVGWLAQRAIGGRFIAFGHTILERLPLTRRIYSAANRIVRTVFGQEAARPFKKVVLVQYPSEGRYAVGFLSGTAPEAIRRHVPDAVSVLIPTSPNPTTGFLIIVPPAHVRELDMSIDEAFTYVLSAGAVTPEQAARLNA
ncbi:MAG TPA: DUF502 domain-containing protein [Longimicrobiales bacterium]|nr:DUF502 domain-containing protein [Longimicrobiales bacterium]